MVCQTIKTGVECAFMTKNGCGFVGGSCMKIVEQCEGCGKVIEYTSEKYCMIYPNPAGKWSVGGCPQATHKKAVKEEARRRSTPSRLPREPQRNNAGLQATRLSSAA